MTKVTFNESLAGIDFVYSAGKTYELDAERAAKWIKAGFCKLFRSSLVVVHWFDQRYGIRLALKEMKCFRRSSLE